METVLALSLGLGLAAACGFRVFVPLLVAALAGNTGHLELASDFAWLGSDAAVIALGVATLLEIGAYYVPWLDNLLDTVASPAAVVAGAVVTAGVVTDVSPMLRWGTAIIAGGGAAGSVQGLTVLTRGASTAMTGGLANPIVSTLEAAAAVAVAVLAVLAPLLAVSLVIIGAVYVSRRLAAARAA